MTTKTALEADNQMFNSDNVKEIYMLANVIDIFNKDIVSHIFVRLWY